MRRSAVILAVSSVLWVLLVAYAITAFYRKISRLRIYLGDDSFASSWIPGFPEQDTSDAEWSAFLTLLRTLIPALILQNVMLHTVRKTWHLLVRIVTSVAFLLTTFGSSCTLFILGIFLITVCLRKLKILFGEPRTLKLLIYGINLLIVFFGVYDSDRIQRFMGNPLGENNHLLLFEVCVAWSAIRAISFGVTSKPGDSPAVMCCYFLYLPCLVLGPVTNYGTFANQIVSNDIPCLRDSLKQACLSVSRAVVWFATMEALFHTVYPMASRIDFVVIRDQLHPVEYFGYCAVLMAHFYVKYLVIYGIAEEAARVEGLWLPERPRCTLRLSSGAEVWRTFDRGLYLWFLELIYVPLGGNILASSLCFVFVCFWHSFSFEVQVWCGLNFVLVIIERLISKYPMVLQVILHCPLHWVAVGSNMFYLGGAEVGSDFFQNLLVPQTFCCAFVASLLACVVGRYFQKEDKIFYRRNAERYNVKRKAS